MKKVLQNMFNLKESLTIRNNPKMKQTAFETKGIIFEDRIDALKKRMLMEQEIYNTTRRNRNALREAKDKYLEILNNRPNEPADDVPIGITEKSNVVIKVHGQKREFGFIPKDHKELGKNLGMMDFETAALMSGSRFVILKGQLARLERAIIAYMLQKAEIHHHLEISPPLLVRNDAMYNSGQLPKFDKELFSTDNFRLIPTAEVPLVNVAAGKTFLEKELPIRYTACTPCFRKEAGSAGKDTSGMIRLHQFYKVELVSITTQEKSELELERITRIAESILEELGLPYRRILLCTGDTGFSAAKTYDIEVWIPSQETYREISSCSNCTDFQAKRMKTKYRTAEDHRIKKHVHTLNGSALAVGRLLVAILENYQSQDGNIVIPSALLPYFGKTVLKQEKTI